MDTFLPGLELSRLFYQEVVGPILGAAFPSLRYSAALIGPGSEVLGFDTPQSTDHHWGPRLLLFLDEADMATHQEQVVETLRHKLPYTFRGYPTNFGTPDAGGTRLFAPIESGPVNHMVAVWHIRGFFEMYLGQDPRAEIPLTAWLAFSEHRLRATISGEVFHDGLGALHPIRTQLAWYPHDVWLYLMAALWKQIGQEEAFVGRCGDVGDELGSKLVAGRLVHAIMRLAFLMERCYAPYSKWFGTGFARLTAAPRLAPALSATLAADAWRPREAALCQAYQTLAEMHNELKLTPALDPHPAPFHQRPYQVIHGERFAEALRAVIDAAEVRGWPLIGSVNQFSHSTDLLEHPELCHQLRTLYE